MKTARRITTNFISLAFSESFSKLIQLFIFITIARAFGTEEFGNFSFAFSFSIILLVVADFGLSQLLIREMSRDKKNINKYLSSAFLIKIFLAVVTVLVTATYVYFVTHTKTTMILIFVMVAFIIIQSLTWNIYSVFRALEKMYYDSVIKMLRAFLLLLSLYTVFYFKKSILYVSLIFPLTEGLILIFSFIILAKFLIKIKIEIDWKFVFVIFRKSFFFCLSFAFSSLLLYIDTIMLQNMKGSAEVGIYSAAYNLLIGFLFIPVMFSNAIYPVFSRYFVKDKALLRLAYRKSFQYIFLIGLPMIVGIYFYSRNIILLIYERGYTESILVLEVLVLFLGLRFVNIISGTALLAVNKQDSKLYSMGFVVIINVLLNIFLIPALGFIGAGIATVISELIMFILYSYFIKKSKLSLDLRRLLVKPIIASVVMALVVYNITELFFGFLTGIIVYASALLLMKFFKKEDKELMIRIIQNR